MSRKKKLPKIPETADVELLIDSMNDRCPTGYRNKVMMLVMYHSGLRVGEVVALRTSDIRLKDKEIRVNNGKGSKDRVVPINPTLYPWLKSYKDERKPKKSLFFTTLKGGSVNPVYIRQVFTRQCKKLGIPNLTPHSLRHRFSTDLLNNGFNIREVQDLLGHSSVEVTQCYLWTNPKEIKDKMWKDTQENTVSEDDLKVAVLKLMADKMSAMSVKDISSALGVSMNELTRFAKQDKETSTNKA